ncbi:MAG: cytochrome c [Chloroflexi bacterium]|nr:cytochrome c [Chloroflexota bacterium]
MAIRWRWILLAGLVVISLASACGSDDGANDSTVADSDDPVERGERIYVTYCASCHGQSGEGEPHWNVKKSDGTLPPPPLNGSGHTWHHGDGTLYKQVKLGGGYLDLPGFKSGMPAFGEQLSDREIVDVLAYVKSLWGNQTIRGVSIREAQIEVSKNDPFPVASSDD